METEHQAIEPLRINSLQKLLCLVAPSIMESIVLDAARARFGWYWQLAVETGSRPIRCLYQPSFLILTPVAAH